MNSFENLIQQLGQLLGTPLQAEKGALCKLFIKGKIHIQLDCDESLDKITITCFICEVPPGKFREEVLSTALKANYADSSLGFFSYADSIQTLILQLYLPLTTTANLLALMLQQLTEKALTWKDSLESATLSKLVPSNKSSFPSPINLP